MLTIGQVKSQLSYNPQTGVITRIASRRPDFIGKKVGSINRQGYLMVWMFGSNHCAHRFAWLLHYGEFPAGDIDHINQLKTDNRIENLRSVSREENARNCPMRSDNKSGKVGVFYYARDGVWVAKISHGGKQITIGHYKAKDDAVSARIDAEKRYGYHENHGM